MVQIKQLRVFIAYLSLIVTIHMLHCQFKPLILIVYAAYPVGCGCEPVVYYIRPGLRHRG